ncbi:hypothetical protein CCZ01_08870, partial [Helicobacter monodelphidis]|uniref:cache domain-containing protein n=1 Tax=Helicobacter sp. 15-1451 TaxID=2004995 RepID=UPI000DCDDC52
MNFYKNLSLKIKILLFANGTIIPLFILMGIIYMSSQNIRDLTDREVYNILKDEYKDRLQLATDSVANIIGQLLEDSKSESEKIAIIAQAIEKFRFEDDQSGYYFVYKVHTPVAHPTRKDLLGKDLSQTKDANGVFYVPELNKVANAGGGFVEYLFSKPLPDGSSIIAEKLAYATLIPNTENIWISTGVYIDNLAIQARETSGVIDDSIEVENLRAITISFFIFIMIFLPLALLFYFNLMSSVRSISRGLNSFFRFLNYEEKSIELISLKSKDEFGAMAIAINENIEKTHQSLDQDSALVQDSLVAIQAAKDGSAVKRITHTGSNPYLNQLRDSVNELLELLCVAIGKDLHELNRVFDSYVKLDFSTSVANASGRVDMVTNTLGEEIRKMLHTSANFAKDLESKSKDLEEAVR